MARDKVKASPELEEVREGQDAQESGEPQETRDVERAELYFATVRLIDTVTKRGTFEGGELLTVGAIRQKYIDWLVEQGFIQPEQRQQG